MVPLILLSDPKSKWVKTFRAAIQYSAEFTATGSQARLKRFVLKHPSGVLVIIDIRRFSNSSQVIDDVKSIHKNVVVLVATSAPDWDDTVSFMKAGVTDIIPKNMDPKQINASLKQWIQYTATLEKG